ncbi:ExbD/TolR family protein [Saccharicrinis sp. FJH54]|uniref:ExbD/TolR family protein n=1 Tax=Saccharicrinis sp. FJH54 TaxID=3344665 RepID=UPI0035D4FED2
MAYKRRTKVNASFSMSSMTDIVFLLLIFFMVTSTLVHPNALKLLMPRKAETKTEQISNYITVRVSSSGTFFVNGKRVDEAGLLQEISSVIDDPSKTYINLTTDKGVTTKQAVTVLNLAKDNNFQVALNIK